MCGLQLVCLSSLCQWIAKASLQGGLGPRLLQLGLSQKDIWRLGYRQHRSKAHPGSKTGDRDEGRYTCKKILKGPGAQGWAEMELRWGHQVKMVRALKVCLCPQGPDSWRQPYVRQTNIGHTPTSWLYFKPLINMVQICLCTQKKVISLAEGSLYGHGCAELNRTICHFH